MSTVYWVSYRIEYNSTYSDRYSELMSRIDAISSAQWNKTTSFHIFESTQTINNPANYFAGALSSVDCFLIRETNVQDARFFGTFTEFTALQKFIPYVTKV